MAPKLHTPILERYAAAPEVETHHCEWPGCVGDAPHRAPKSRDEPDAFRWFCKDHAREYNKAWNFFAGMTDDQVEAHVRHDTVWNRPSWPLGSGPAIKAFMEGHFDDPFGAFEDDEPKRRQEERPGTERLELDIRRALKVLELEIPIDVAQVKARYKALVKRHHPDARLGGDGSDDRMKEINHAYQVVMNFLES